MMNPRIKKLWVAALRSGNYKQGIGALRTENDEFCCLGVLCDLAEAEGIGAWEYTPLEIVAEDIDANAWTFVTETTDNPGILPSEVMQWAGVESGNPVVVDSTTLVKTSLSGINDSGGTFDQIADAIEGSL